MYRPRERVGFKCVGKSRTKQSFANECDINNIMRKFQKTGAVSHLNRYGAEYGYATSLDFAESMRVVTKGQEMFNDLPSSIRSRFGNDPALFLDFVQDDSNVDEMVELGLLDKAVLEDRPEAVEPVEEPGVDEDAQVAT